MYVGNGSEGWCGRVLIIPAISVGNVGQLAVDVILSTLEVKKVGYIYTDSILPVAGNDPFASKIDDSSCSLMTSCEVFESKEKNIVIIQQRAPFIKGRVRRYREWLVKWIKDVGFKSVVILASSYSHLRTDKQIFGSQLRYLTSPKFPEEDNQRIKDCLGWTELEEHLPEAGLEHHHHIYNYIPGGGITRKLYEDLCYGDVSTMCLLMFCSEGDNIDDALRLATHFNSWSKLIPEKSLQWKIPVSWRLFYGSKSNQILFQ